MDKNIDHSTNLASFHHHTLRLQHPAFGLLPLGKQPFLEMPNGVPDREEPEFTSRGLSPNDLDYFVRFPTAYSITDDVTLFDGERSQLAGPQPLNLTACIDRLSSLPGVSDLRFVSYVDDWDVVTRFQLKTSFYTNGGKLKDPVQDFELSSADIAKMIRTMAKQNEWVRLLDDMIHSKTDRAYLYRYKELVNWDEEWLDDDEAKWDVEWDVNPLVPIRQLFANRLRSVYQLPDGTIKREPLGMLQDFKGEALYAQMPCGHRAMMPANHIHHMHIHDVLYAVCDHCEERILKRADDRQMAVFYDRVRRYAWEDKNADWEVRCKRVRNDSSLVEVSSGTLSASLLNSFETFELPESMSPRSLCPSTYPESRVLLNKLIDTLRAHTSLPAMTPKALFTNLEKLAWKLIEEIIGDAVLMAIVLPPGFEDFVTRWMTRAVNDAVGSQADDEQDEDIMDVVTKMDRTKIDPKAAAVESDLDEILKQIGETSLEPTRDGDEQDGETQDENIEGKEVKEEL